MIGSILFCFRQALISSILINVYISDIQALAFSPLPGHGSKKASTTSINVNNSVKQINFSGQSSHQILISRSQICNGAGEECVPNPYPPRQRESLQSLPKWLASRHSQCHLLGSEKVSKVGNGIYKAELSSISWFGMELVPIFFQRISFDDEDSDNDEHIMRIKISIEDSEVHYQKSSKIGGLVERVMKKCSFQGSNNLKCCKIDQRDGEEQWMLSSDFSLNLKIPLMSRLMILPPGFNAIGSKIVKSTVENKVKENLFRLAEEYHAFSNNSGESGDAIGGLNDEIDAMEGSCAIL